MVTVIIIVIININKVQRTLCNICLHFRVIEWMIFFGKSSSGNHSHLDKSTDYYFFTDKKVRRYNLMSKIISLLVWIKTEQVNV